MNAKPLHSSWSHVALALTAMIVTSACGDGGSAPNNPPNNPPNNSPTTYLTTLVTANSSVPLGTRTSQAPTNGQPAGPAFDDFTLISNGSIKTVSWQGTYCTQTSGAAAPSPTASNFVISIYPDASGRPNIAGRLQTATFTAAQAGERLESTVPGLACGPSTNTTFGLYTYSATLSPAFTAAAGTKYWISIVATTPSYDVIWGWRDGSSANNLSLQSFSGTYTQLTIDRAYSISN